MKQSKFINYFQMKPQDVEFGHDMTFKEHVNFDQVTEEDSKSSDSVDPLGKAMAEEMNQRQSMKIYTNFSSSVAVPNPNQAPTKINIFEISPQGKLVAA